MSSRNDERLLSSRPRPIVRRSRLYGRLGCHEPFLKSDSEPDSRSEVCQSNDPVPGVMKLELPTESRKVELLYRLGAVLDELVETM
jgi:hypothetical protein